MEDRQYVKKLIAMHQGFEIERYKDPAKEKEYSSFEGIPKKHPADDRVLVLFTAPFSDERTFYEFSIDSIAKIEELGTITSTNGESAYTIRVWVKKGMPALKSIPFIID